MAISTTERIDEGSRTGRRRVVGLSAAFVAGLATLFYAEPAAAMCDGPSCCGLAKCTQCSYQVEKRRYTCPSGYNRTLWSCVKGGTTYFCGECSKGTNCYAGPFACSIWFT